MKKLLAIFTSGISLFSLMLPMLVPVTVEAQTTSGNGSCYTFTRNLGEGRPINAEEGSAIVRDLSDQGFWNANTPITSYTEAVASAISGFQEKYAAQVLTPNGLSYGTGYLGASTRAELNSLYGCSATTTTNHPVQTFQCPLGWTCTPPTQSTNSIPSITSIYPSSGPVGTSVTLNGSNLSGVTAINIQPQAYGDLQNSETASYTATPTSVSASSVTFTVPANAVASSYNVSAVAYNGQTHGTVPWSNMLGFTVTNGTVPVPTGITTPGVAGTLTVSESASPYNGIGLNLQAGLSDMQVGEISVDFNVRPWLYFSTFSLINQTTGQVLVPATSLNSNNFTEITAGSDYRYSFGGLNFIVPHGQTVVILFTGQAIGQNTLTNEIISASVRAVDGTGVTQTSSTNPNSMIQPHITSLSPSTGQVGTAVTIYGSGFTSLNNILKFQQDLSNSSITRYAQYSGLGSPNGNTLSFIVPSTLTNSEGEMGEPITVNVPVVPVSYEVYLVNSQGESISNGVNFTVTP